MFLGFGESVDSGGVNFVISKTGQKDAQQEKEKKKGGMTKEQKEEAKVKIRKF